MFVKDVLRKELKKYLSYTDLHKRLSEWMCTRFNQIFFSLWKRYQQGRGPGWPGGRVLQAHVQLRFRYPFVRQRVESPVRERHGAKRCQLQDIAYLAHRPVRGRWPREDIERHRDCRRFLFQVERGRADLDVDAGLPHEAGQSAEDPGPREAPLCQVHQEQRHRDAPSLGQRRDHASDTIPPGPRDGEPNGRRYVLKLSATGDLHTRARSPRLIHARALVGHLSSEGVKKRNHRRETRRRITLLKMHEYIYLKVTFWDHLVSIGYRVNCRISPSDAFQGVQREVQAYRAVQAIATRRGASGGGHQAHLAERAAAEEQIRREHQLGARQEAHLP